MRICLISREFPPDTGWGGIATFVDDLAHGLVEIGHEVEVITLAADDKETTSLYGGMIVHRVRWTDRFESHQRMLTAVPYSHNILKQITALWTKFVSIHRVRPFDVVETPEMFAEGLFVSMTRCAPLVVRLYTPHFKFIDEKFHNINSNFDHQFIAMLERITMLSANVVTSPSEDLADYVCKDLGMPRTQISIVRDPVNTEKFSPVGQTTAANGGRLNVLFAGRLEERKGIYYLIDAIPKVVRRFPNVRFTIVGRDTNTASGKKSVRAELERLIKSSGCADYVDFVGPVPNTEMPAYFRSANICVVPSLYDNAPFTCIEALSCGTPVIGTSAGGMKEYITHGQSGLIVPPADADALSEALLDLLMNADKRVRFGEFAREHVLSNFDRKEIARQSVALYEQAQERHQQTQQFAIYRHTADDLLPDGGMLLQSYDNMLYDMLYRHSWRFRLSHWFCMLRDRPRLTAARGVAKAYRSMWEATGRTNSPMGLETLEKQIASKAKGTTGATH